MQTVSTGQITIIDSNDNIAGYLTNETVVVPTAADGSGATYTSAGGTFKVFSGVTDVTTASVFNITGGTDGGASWTKLQNGLTLTLNETTGVYSLSGSSWTTDSEAFTLNATYSGVTISKVYKITKSKNGQGITLTATAQAFTFTDGIIDNGQSDITFTATLNGLSGTVTWSSSPSVTLTGSGNTRALSSANFGANKYITVTASINGISDSISVVKLDRSTAAAGATVGAQSGTNLRDASGNIVTDISILNQYSGYNVLSITSDAELFSFNKNITGSKGTIPNGALVDKPTTYTRRYGAGVFGGNCIAIDDATANLVPTPITYSSWSWWTIGGCVDIASSFEDGVCRRYFERQSPSSDYRAVSASGSSVYPITIDKTKIYTISFEAKIDQAASDINILLKGTAVSTVSPYEKTVVTISSNTKVASISNGTTVNNQYKLQDGYYRYEVTIPTAFWAGTGNTCNIVLISGWTELGTYDIYTRKIQLEEKSYATSFTETSRSSTGRIVYSGLEKSINWDKFSFLVWMRRNTTGVLQRIFGLWTTTSKRSFFCIDADNILRYTLWDVAQTPSQRDIKGTTAIADKEWHLVGVSVNRSAGEVRFFKDNTSELITGQTINYSDTTIPPFTFGMLNHDDTISIEPANSLFDNAVIFKDSIITPDYVKAVYAVRRQFVDLLKTTSSTMPKNLTMQIIEDYTETNYEIDGYAYPYLT